MAPLTSINYGPGGDPRSLQGGGPLLPVEIRIPDDLAKKLRELEKDIPAPVAGYALIDTGATVSAIDDSVVQALGLSPVGVAKIGTAGGVRDAHLYPASFSFPGTSIHDVEIGHLLGVDLSGHVLGVVHHAAQGEEGHETKEAKVTALVGRDLLQNFLMIYNGPAGIITLAL